MRTLITFKIHTSNYEAQESLFQHHVLKPVLIKPFVVTVHTAGFTDENFSANTLCSLTFDSTLLWNTLLSRDATQHHKSSSRTSGICNLRASSTALLRRPLPLLEKSGLIGSRNYFQIISEQLSRCLGLITTIDLVVNFTSRLTKSKTS